MDSYRLTLPACFALLAFILFSIPCYGGREDTQINSKPESSPTASKVKQTAEASVEIRRQSQKLNDAWAREEAELLSEIDTLKKDLEALKWRRKKTAAYLEDLEKKMTALSAKDQAAKEIRNELEPFLDERIEALKQFAQG